MKQLSILLLLLICSVSQAQIYSDTTWERWYGQANRHEDPWHYKHGAHYDGGLLTLTFVDRDAYLTTLNKTDVNGFLLWEKSFNSSDNIYILTLVSTSDGGILCAGSYTEEGEWQNPLILKLNVCGELEWCKKIPLSEYSFTVDIEEDKKGDYIALIYQSDAYLNDKCQLYKFTPDGEIIWHDSYARKTDYPLIENLQVTGIDISEDNSYYLSGYCIWPADDDPNGTLQYRPIIIKVNEDGKEQWVLPFEVEGALGAIAWNKIFEVEEDHFVLFMSHLDLDQGGSLKFDKNANVESFQFKPFLENISHFNGFAAIHQVGEDRFSGIYNFYFPENFGYTERGLITFDEEVNILNYSLNENFIFPIGTFKSHDNHFMNIATWPNAQGTEFTDVYMAKYNENLSFADTINDTNWNYDSLCPDAIQNGDIILYCDPIGIDEPIQVTSDLVQQIKISPNPAQVYIEIEIEEAQQIEYLQLEIFDISGRICFQEKLKKSQREKQVNIEHWEEGMYLVNIKSAGLIIASSKFVKQ